MLAVFFTFVSAPSALLFFSTFLIRCMIFPLDLSTILFFITSGQEQRSAESLIDIKKLGSSRDRSKSPARQFGSDLIVRGEGQRRDSVTRSLLCHSNSLTSCKIRLYVSVILIYHYAPRCSSVHIPYKNYLNILHSLIKPHEEIIEDW